jgi:hypothetical protein
MRCVAQSDTTSKDPVEISDALSSSNKRDDKERNETSNLTPQGRAAIDGAKSSNDSLIKLENDLPSGGKPPLPNFSPGTKANANNVNTGLSLCTKNVPIAASLTPYGMDTLRTNEVQIPAQYVSEHALHSSLSHDLLLTHALSENYDGHVAPVYDCARSVGKFL